jgi:hypothetical protein
MDGGLVPVRGEGWKELKVGVIGTLAPPWELAASDLLRSHDLHYSAHLGGVEAFSATLWQLAVQQQVPSARQVADADGALDGGWLPICSVQHATGRVSCRSGVRLSANPLPDA